MKFTYDDNCIFTIKSCEKSPLGKLTAKFKVADYEVKDGCLTVVSDSGKTYVVTPEQGGYDSVKAMEADVCAKYEACTGMIEEIDMPGPEDKELVEILTAYHPDDPKTPVKLFVFNNPRCVTTDFEGTNVVDINDYNMANTPGYGRELPKNSSPLIPFSICGPVTGTLADILPELAADADFETAVTEEVPTGLTRLQIYQAPKGTTCKGQPVTAGGVLIGDRSLDDAEGWCKKKDYEDKDCDNYSEGIDLTTVMEIPAGAAILGEAIGICLDADDNDASVQ